MANLGIMEHMVGVASQSDASHPYYLFEPWDIESRSDDLYTTAREDGFDLLNPDRVEFFGRAPRLFQTGYLFSESFIAAMFASNQSGKSYGACMDLLIQLTGELPIAFRYEKGVDTGIKREVNQKNIRRFGRFDAISGEFLDRNEKARQDNTWNCGTVVGAGEYPKTKLAPHGSKIWIVTYKQARDEAWWPLLKGMIPEHLLDKTRSQTGFDNREYCVHLINSASIHFITYEQGPERLEAAGVLQDFEKLWMVLFDEEPPSRKYWATVTQRVDRIRLVTTPYQGMSWSYEDILSKSPNSPDIEIYHCTKYDCPYHTTESINRSKETLPAWEIGARIYGFHTDQSGKPYYHGLYDHIQNALRGKEFYELKKIYPDFVWENPRVIALNRDKIDMCDAYESDRDAWKIYEMPKPGVAYWMSVDTSEGAAEASEVQDMHCAQILRAPKDGEGEWPVQCAVLDSGIPADEFARVCLYGCAAYNNALMAPEALGKSAGIFLHEITGWPFLFTMVVTNDITRRQTEKVGFFTSSKNRTELFDRVGTMMKENIERPMFGLRHMKTIKEIAGCIVGKRGRPDHAKRGHDDSLMALGIGLYVWKICPQKIQDNSGAFQSKMKSETEFEKWAKKDVETRPLLGSRKGMDRRSKQKAGRW